jgi:hypothetical protein
MDGGHVIPEEIRGLLEQRSTFQGWLDRLEELGSEYRPEVAEKVRSDYSGRLSEVEATLEGHRSELETALAERTEAVERVTGQHDARTAELEETQLRHVVGEFDDDEWEARRAEHQGLIDELEAKLDTERSAVKDLEAVLGEFAGGEPPAEAPPEEAAAEAEEPGEPPMPEDLVVAEDEWPEPEAEAPEEGVEVEESESEVADDWMTRPLDDVEAQGEAEEVESDAVKAVLVDPEVAESAFADADFVEAEVVDEADAEEDVATEEAAEGEVVVAPAAEAEPDEFMDELEFLESLSLDDADSFDAVSAMLDEDESGSGEDADSKRKSEDH